MFQKFQVRGSSKARFSSNPITASGQICVWNRVPIGIKVLAGRADNESPIHIGLIATLGELKKDTASMTNTQGLNDFYRCRE